MMHLSLDLPICAPCLRRSSFGSLVVCRSTFKGKVRGGHVDWVILSNDIEVNVLVDLFLTVKLARCSLIFSSPSSPFLPQFSF